MKLTLTMVTIDSADPAPLAAWWAARLEAPIVQENEGWFYVIDATPLLAIQKVEDPTPGKNEELSNPVDWVIRRRSVVCSIGRVVRPVCRS